MQVFILDQYGWMFGPAFVLIFLLLWLNSFISRFRHTSLLKDNIGALNRAISVVTYGTVVMICIVILFSIFLWFERFSLIEFVPFIIRQLVCEAFVISNTTFLVFNAAYIALLYILNRPLRIKILGYASFLMIFTFSGSLGLILLERFGLPGFLFSIFSVVGLFWGFGVLWFLKFDGLKDIVEIKQNREKLTKQIGEVQREIYKLQRARRKKQLREWQEKLKVLLLEKEKLTKAVTADKLETQMLERSRLRRLYKKVENWLTSHPLEDSETWVNDFMKKFIQILFAPIVLATVTLFVFVIEAGLVIFVVFAFAGGIALLWQNYRMLSILNRYPTRTSTRAIIEVSYGITIFILLGVSVLPWVVNGLVLISVYFLGSFWHKLVNLEYTITGKTRYELEYRYNIRSYFGFSFIYLFLLPLVPPESLLYLFCLPILVLAMLWKLIFAGINAAKAAQLSRKNKDSKS